MRDFNRVAIDGVDPEIVEKTQSAFEGKAATALKTLEETSDFSGETKNVILELIGIGISARLKIGERPKLAETAI